MRPHEHAAHHEVEFRAEVRLLDRPQGDRHPVPVHDHAHADGRRGARLAVRWQLAFPWSNMPILGRLLFADQGGQISPEFYTMLFTMHATVMIFLVIIPILAGAFGNYCIPLMIGADDMAFPLLNMLSYWFMWPAIGLFHGEFLCPRRRPVGRLDRLPRAVRPQAGGPRLGDGPNACGCWASPSSASRR